MNLEAFAVVLVAVLVYLNSLRGEFVFDDANVLMATRKLSKRGPGFWLKCMIPWRRSLMPRPLLFLTYRLDFALSRDNPLAWHVTNVAIHAANSALVYWLLTAFYSGHGPALGALVFAVHPTATSAVASVSGRSSSLCAMFYLSGLLAVVSGFWIIAAVCGWLAFKSKAEAAVFPIAALIVWWFAGSRL